MVSRVLAPCTLIRVQTWESQAAVPLRVAQALDVAWPAATGTTATGRADILCLGPTDWLVMAAALEGVPLLQVLNEAFQGSAFRATNVSSALSRILVEGTHARTLLSKGCSLDVHPEALPPGRSARTRLASMSVVVRCKQASTFECIVSSSYRDYLISWLADAAAEF